MADQQSNRVHITREQSGTVNGVPLTGRVYVTGPHFGSRDIYSSTVDPAKAATFDRATAEHMLATGKWPGLAPRIEEIAHVH